MISVRTLLAALFLVACSGTPRDGSGGADEAPDGTPAEMGERATAALPAGCEGLEESILKVRPTREALHREFGAPDSIFGVAERNRHVEGVTDSLFAVYYPGLTVTLHMPGGGSDLPTTVQVEDNRYLAFPRIGIGAAAHSVVAALGPPAQPDTSYLTYDCGTATDQPVRFELANGRVRRITIEYYVD